MITWLFKIARNQCVDLVRARQKGRWSAPRAGDDAKIVAHPDEQASPERATEAREIASLMLGGLHDRERELILLHHGLGMSYDELARVTGCSLDSVKSRLKRGRAAAITIARKILGSDVEPAREGSDD